MNEIEADMTVQREQTEAEKRARARSRPVVLGRERAKTIGTAREIKGADDKAEENMNKSSSVRNIRSSMVTMGVAGVAGLGRSASGRRGNSTRNR